MSYTHFTIAERSKIETLRDLGFSIRRIARILGRAPSSVSRELNRNPYYQCDQAQERYKQKKANCGAKSKLTSEIKEKVQEKLTLT
ncbi:helix-turn-helix domain-containing protein, partial [Jeotgalibaca dankookensis]